MALHICKLCRFLSSAVQHFLLQLLELLAVAPPSLAWMHFTDFTTFLLRFAHNADMFVWPLSVQLNSR